MSHQFSADQSGDGAAAGFGGLNCPPAVEELELFADAADENLLAWAFCGREASQVDLVRWRRR